MCERQCAKSRFDLCVFARLGFHELQSGWNVREKFFDQNRRALVATGRNGVGESTELGDHLSCFVRASRFRLNRQSADGRDAGECFTAKTERREIPEVIGRCDLAGRVTSEREFQLARSDAFSIVGDANSAAPLIEFDFDVLGAGVDRVFDEFFDEMSRTLDDFARGDLIDDVAREKMNGRWREALESAHVGGKLPNPTLEV